MAAKASRSKIKISKAVADPLLLRIPLSLGMSLYGLSYAKIVEARKRAADGLDKAGRTRLDEDLRRDKLVATLRVAEERHPGLVKSLGTTTNYSVLADQYGLTRQRVQQVNAALADLSRILGKTTARVAEMTSAGSLPDTYKDKAEAMLAKQAG